MKRNTSRLESFRAHTGVDGAVPATPEEVVEHAASVRRAVVGLFAAAACVIAVATYLAPGVDGRDDTSLLGAAVLLAVVAAATLRAGIPPSRPVRVLAATLAVVCVLFVTGSRDQVVIDGKVYASSSREARSHRLVEEVYDDLSEMSRLDTLLALGPADARAQYSSYEPARDRLVAISAYWSRVDLAELPDPDFIDIVNTVKTAATFGAEAMDIRFGLLTEPDQRGEEALAANRATFSAGVLDAGARLLPLAERYSVDLRVVTE